MVNSILNDIFKNKKEDLDLKKLDFPLQELKKKLSSVKNRRDFSKALSKKSNVNIIAELKKASPSKGLLCPEFDPLSITKQYVDSGACAISVLTEKKYFHGDLAFLKLVKDNSDLPVLRKDFIFDSYQIYESLVFGADAVLLIAALLEPDKLKELIKLSLNLGLDCLVEIHNEDDLNKVHSSSAKIIGINNRNLNDFSVDKTNAIKMLPKISKDKILVVESGIESKNDVKMYTESGVNNFLVGEVLMKSPNIGEKLKELRSIK
ncbi:MAG: indole-3-glycerol phosphate synthase TrpC [Endomicrobiales bacterium]|nr:indole-3-glycerol phosphate synthase TrpC [Endomicrobiales bacterium]